MNNGAQGGQPAAGQPSNAQTQQRRPGPPQLFKPEHLRNLPDVFKNEKVKWENALRQLWEQVDNNPPESQVHLEAKRKIFEFTRNLTQKMQAYRAQQAQQAAQQNSAPRPASQGQPQAAQGGEGSGAKPNPDAAKKLSSIPPKLMEHVAKFPYVPPSNYPPNSPEAQKWLSEAKNRYLKALVNMTNCSERIAAMDNAVQKRTNEGKPLTADEEKDYKEKKEQLTKTHNEAKNFADSFRTQQTAAKEASKTAGSPTQPQPGATNNAQPRPQVNPHQQPVNPVLQNTKTVTAAMEAARNQQMGGARPQASSQPQQVPTPTAPSMPQTNIKQEAGIPPQINTSVSNMQGRPGMQNSPQSAVPPSAGGAPQSATSQAATVPHALTHTDALTKAARSYSTGQAGSTPQVMGHSHPSAPRESQNVMTNKMPIPKALHDRAIAPPQPVTMAQSRPTFPGGPGSLGNGSMSQPVLPKTPGFTNSSDDNSVLSKKKLDELVKQVTGGGQGDGPSLMPEVEASMLTVADTFVDQVLHNACKMAKERGSKVLEIRDIQLTLERNYNIRIPGYASDEIRTVRKIQPAPAWIAKMSAVQAAKVTGGKNAD